MKLVSVNAPPSLTLEEAKKLPLNFDNAETLPVAVSSIAMGCQGTVYDHNVDFLFDYDVFPGSILLFQTERRRASGVMRLGDIILQRLKVPPFFPIRCLDFAVRITGIIQEERRFGFAYSTLEGHAERGVAEFYFEEQYGGIFFVIRTRSEAAFTRSSLLRALLVRPMQKWCTRRALKHVKRRFREVNP